MSILVDHFLENFNSKILNTTNEIPPNGENLISGKQNGTVEECPTSQTS